MPTINGTANGETLFGTSGVDVINGLGGNDHLFGFAGSDVLNGGNGADSLGGGAGADDLIGGAGTDILSGGQGGDLLVGGIGIDTASYVGSLGGVTVNLATGVHFGGDADGDTLDEIENVTGTTFDDFITGDAGANVLIGLDGIDVLRGGNGNDVLDGGAGIDEIDGGGDNDTVSYASATAGIGVNLLLNSGGDGDTLISIENVDGSDFNDFLFGDNQDNRLQGFDGTDRLRGFIGDDVLSGGAGGDILLGGASNDRLIGGEGADVLNGEGGIDTVSYASSSGGVEVSLDPAGGAGEGGDAQGDRIFQVENVTGSQFTDVLFGSTGDNTLIGGSGIDLLVGDLGNDRFDFTALNQGGDGIADFSNAAGNNDTLGFLGRAFGNLPVGALAANRFVANADGAATSLDQRFVYETDTGVLSFDSNGSAAGGVTAIAQISGAPTLTVDDFMMF